MRIIAGPWADIGVAIETAATTLVGGDLNSLVRARELSRATMRNIGHSLFLATTGRFVTATSETELFTSGIGRGEALSPCVTADSGGANGSSEAIRSADARGNSRRSGQSLLRLSGPEAAALTDREAPHATCGSENTLGGGETAPGCPERE